MPGLTDDQCNAIAEMVPLTFTQAENTRALIRAGYNARAGESDAVPVAWEVRHFEGEYSATRGWSEWERIKPQGLQTVENRVSDFRAYIAMGNKYELRALYARPTPAPASEVEKP